MILSGFKEANTGKQEPDGWLVRISMRLTAEDINRLQAESETVRRVFTERLSRAANVENCHDVSTRSNYLLVIRPGRRKDDSDDPLPVMRALLEKLAEPAESSIGPVFPRLNAVLTAAPCVASDRKIRLMLTEALQEAENTGSGIVLKVDTRTGLLERVTIDTQTTGTPNAIKRAIDTDNVVMHYQPVINLSNGRIHAFEALMRLTVENGTGLVSPAHFIAEAEKTGLIHELGRVALRKASAQMTQWRNHYGTHAPARIAVNVSAPQLTNENFVAEVQDIFAASRLGLDTLTLELTETKRIPHMPDVRMMLNALRRHGVLVALDDFGVEYSNLAYLRDLEVDVVKIDRSFLDGGNNPQRAHTILKKTVELTQALDMHVVVEGITTAAQMKALTELGIEYGQGGYFGFAMDAESASDLILNTPCSHHKTKRE